VFDLLDSASILAGLKSNQWKSRAELEELQAERLRGLIRHAAHKVPFYKDRLGAVRDIEDLASLPLLRKDDIRMHWDSMLDKSQGKLTGFSTSGSSGMPIKAYFSRHELNRKLALGYLPLIENGVGPLDSQARIIYYSLKPNPLQRLGLFRNHYLPMHARPEENLRSLKRLRPDALHSYPSILMPLANWNMSSDEPLTVRKIFTSAEVLSANARGALEKSFNAKVHDIYGATETGWIAWECGEGSLHLHSDSVVAEVVDGSGHPAKGEGELVLTPLWRRSMPLIRYSIGDRASFSNRCKCGRGLHVLNPIEGRSNDLITLPSGRLFPAYFIIRLNAIPGILQFQAYQESPGELLIRIVPEKGFSAKDRVIKEVSSSFPEPVEVKVDIVDSIMRGPTGKICAVLSNVKADS
jgi:phenylacetate-CoA ligase